MKFKFIDPNQILSVILALMVLGVGVFASFTVFANIPASAPVGSNIRTGNQSLYDATNLLTNTTTPVLRWIPATGFLNNTAVCVIYAHGDALNGGYTSWYVLQTVGAVNGTFCANGTMRVGHICGAHNTSLRLEYPLSGQQTTALENATYNSVLNVSGTSTQVFNIIGVVMIIAAIMSIIGLIYTYVKPRA